MTCQACQTWNSESDHRCQRCGRRLRSTPTRRVRDSYPIAASALAYQTSPAATIQNSDPYVAEPGDQQPLFRQRAEPKVIPFDQLTSPTERESIRARAAGFPRSNPGKSATVEVSAGQGRRRRVRHDGDQQQFDFFVRTEADALASGSTIQHGTPVADPMLRLGATMIDGLMIALGTSLFLAVVRLLTGSLPLDKLSLMAYATGTVAVAAAYKLLWCFANRDSYGVTMAGLRTVDLDGNCPCRKRRFWRAISSLLSLGAAGLGVIWTFVDADHLTWHDQISGTFPTSARY
jgi:uncharacterized RDD family membrane protein YckC